MYLQYYNLDSKTRTLLNYSLKSVICYDNWIENATKSPTQHAYSSETLNVCQNHISDC